MQWGGNATLACPATAEAHSMLMLFTLPSLMQQLCILKIIFICKITEHEIIIWILFQLFNCITVHTYLCVTAFLTNVIVYKAHIYREK